MTDIYQQAINIAHENQGLNQTELAEIAGCARSTFGERFRKAKLLGLEPEKSYEREITLPILPSDKRAPGEIIDQLCKAFERKNARHKAKKWMPFKVNVKGPIGVCFYGDIHADNSGCDWPLLKYHLEAVAQTEYAYGVFMGDVLDNWIGRLEKFCKKHGITEEEAKEIVRWIAGGSGVDWLLWLIGNHDEWHDYHREIKSVCKNICQVEDWRARFRFVFPNGREAKIDAAHDHKGHSQYNPLHGQQKVVYFEEMADIVIGAHKHYSALQKHQHPATGKVYWLARAAGYKAIDPYAEKLQFDSQTTGQSIFAVFEPDDKEETWITCFDDVDKGIEYLKHRREVYESTTRDKKQ